MSNNSAPKRILFVCLGNICRSPMAQGVFEHMAAREGPSKRFEVDSAGIGSWHVGNKPDRRAIAAAARRGIDLTTQRARQVAAADFETFDHILAMDASNFEALIARSTQEEAHKVSMFLERGDVPDPYYGGDGGFDDVLDLIENGVRILLRRLG